MGNALRPNKAFTSQPGAATTAPRSDGAVIVSSVKFTETAGAGTYTGAFALPAGAVIEDIIVHQEALWTAATSASLEVGDTGDPDGFYTAVDLKATDLLADESLSFAKAGGVEGAYVTATHVTNRYSATARTITATVVTVGGAGTAGRTTVSVLYYLVTGAGSATKA